MTFFGCLFWMVIFLTSLFSCKHLIRFWITAESHSSSCNEVWEREFCATLSGRIEARHRESHTSGVEFGSPTQLWPWLILLMIEWIKLVVIETAGSWQGNVCSPSHFQVCSCSKREHAEPVLPSVCSPGQSDSVVSFLGDHQPHFLNASLPSFWPTDL